MIFSAPRVSGRGRVVVEKPLGRDLATAGELNRTLHRVFGEPAIFRIDHPSRSSGIAGGLGRGKNDQRGGEGSKQREPSYKLNVPRPESHALEVRRTTKLGALFERAAAAHPGQSGINYIRSARVALEGRLAMVELAQQSLDMQYYIWDPDISGGLLGERVVRAAERGVRVRLLLDDISVVDRDSVLARLTGHPNIEIRAFNPFRDRKRWGDIFGHVARINRRSHNKIFVADNAMTIIGFLGHQVDHIFVRDLEVVHAEVPRVASSDHNPVLLELRVASAHPSEARDSLPVE